MMDLLGYAVIFVWGMLIGVTAFVGYGMYQVRKIKKAKTSLLEEVKKKAVDLEQKYGSVKDRLLKAAQIAQTQMELRSQAEMPSKNSLHSKYKNGLAAEINELEQQKLDVLKSVLAEGFNPMITVIHDGGSKEELPLSDYVLMSQDAVNSIAGNKKEVTPPPPPTSPESVAPKKVGKFFVYSGGKDDGKAH
jgi:hypothetical protein